jgi:sugar/nucleoside kinase (ribokinase family)
MSSAKILGIGESIIDYMYGCDDLQQPISNEGKTFLSKDLGGPVLSAMILLSRLGLDCTFVSIIGNDAEGELIKSRLLQEGVHFIPDVQVETKKNTIYVEAGTGRRQKVRGPVTHQPLQKLTPEFIAQFDVILVDRHERAAFQEICLNKKPTAKLIIDPSDEVSEFTLQMIKIAEYPIIPIESIQKIAPMTNLDDSLVKVSEYCSHPLIVTAGEQGSLICENGEVTRIAPKIVKAVDVTGAGDIYRGAFAYGICQDWSLNACGSFANKVAALQCLKIGNVAAIPSREEIHTLIKES